MIYFLAILALIYPAIANRNNDKKFALIVLFTLQCAIQPFFATGDPLANYVIIMGINFCYAAYVLVNADDKWWRALSGITFLASFLACYELFLYQSDISQKSWEYTFHRIETVTMCITAVQTFLIIKASGGYVGVLRDFWRNFKADALRVNALLRGRISRKLGKKT